MHDILLDIQQRLRRKEYKNEEHVRLSLVARLVQELGWDVWNPTEVYTEFKATKKEDNTRVDVALFTRDFEDTAIFIECKGVGAFATDLAAVERQLRDYNRDHTALFTIITDGRHWRFYFSFTSGEFKDKLFCKFDLQQDGLDEIAGYLDTFLRRDNITNHSARQKAEAYLMLGKKDRAMQDVLPDAQKLVSQPPFPSLPEAMVQLLAAKVLIITPAEAQAFLMGTTLEKVAEPTRPISPPMPVAKPTITASATPPTRRSKAAKTPAPATPQATLIGEKFSLSQGILHATAYLQANGSLLVQAGSRAALVASASLADAAQLLQNELINGGVIIPEAECLVFTEDYLFTSANLAASIIVARSVNAQIAWKHATDKQVRDFLT